MVFTILHPLISFLLFYPLRRRLEVFSFLLAAMLPDIESVYYGFRALGICGNDFVCLAEYPSHYFLHSFLGIVVLAILAAFVVKKFRKSFRLNNYEMKVLYASAVFGGFSHLLIDSTVHKGADALSLFWPLEQRFSFIFPEAHLLWNVVAILGFATILYLWKQNKLKKIVK